jgi:hypothetical protein
VALFALVVPVLIAAFLLLMERIEQVLVPLPAPTEPTEPTGVAPAATEPVAAGAVSLPVPRVAPDRLEPAPR